MSSGLQLFKIPLLLLQMVYEKMPLLSLFELSFCSKKSKELIEVVRLNVERLDLWISPKTATISVTSRRSDCNKTRPTLHIDDWTIRPHTVTDFFQSLACNDLRVEVTVSPVRLEKCRRNGLGRKIGRIPIGLTYREISIDLEEMDFGCEEQSADAFVWCRNEKERLEVYLYFARFFSRMCRAKECEVQCDRAPRDYVLGIAKLPFAKLTSFSTFETSKLTETDVEFLFNNVNCVNIDLIEQFSEWRYQKAFKHREVSGGQWIGLDCLLEMESEKVQISGTSLDSSDVNTLLKKWKSGGLKNLKELFLSRTDPGFDTEADVLEGLEAFDWSPPLRNDTHGCHCVAHRSVLRSDDGNLATLEFDQWNMRFFTWELKH